MVACPLKFWNQFTAYSSCSNELKLGRMILNIGLHNCLEPNFSVSTKGRCGSCTLNYCNRFTALGIRPLELKLEFLDFSWFFRGWHLYRGSWDSQISRNLLLLHLQMAYSPKRGYFWQCVIFMVYCTACRGPILDSFCFGLMSSDSELVKQIEYLEVCFLQLFRSGGYRVTIFISYQWFIATNCGQCRGRAIRKVRMNDILKAFTSFNLDELDSRLQYLLSTWATLQIVGDRFCIFLCEGKLTWL